MHDSARMRSHMIQAHLSDRGICDSRVLEAFANVKREQFVSGDLQHQAYEDRPLPIGEEQTISQPYIVALTATLLELTGNEKLLEVGTGSGYAAAIFAHLVKDVYTVERFESLATLAQERFAKLGYSNVHLRLGDGTLGWNEFAPYDAIAVAAGAKTIPTALLSQLAIGGRLVIPVGPDANSQMLVHVRRTSPTEYSHQCITHVRFVPLVGDESSSN